MKNKKPMVKETVGALYYAFNKPTEKGDFDINSYEETIRSDVVKNIGTTENSESTVVRASGRDYVTASQTSSVEQAVEVVAFDPGDVAKMRGDSIGKYLVKSGKAAQRPYFAFGKVVKKLGGAIEFVWYPKCQLVENTDDIATSEDTYSEQNDTLTIRALEFDDEGNKSIRVNSEMDNFPAELTEDMFFEKPLTTDEEIEELINQKKMVKVEVVDGSKDVCGKTANELQENIKIDTKGAVTGTLKYVTGYTGFSSKQAEQSGNYLALYFPEAKEGIEITCEVKGEGAIVKKPVKVDTEDGQIVFKIANKEQTIEVVSKEKQTKTLTLKDLVLNQE